jgi:hypothetical protein
MTIEVDAWSTTASSNTTVATINVDEGCPAANVNNAIRAIMAAVKEMSDYIDTIYANLGANADITSLRQSTTISATGTIASTSIGFRGLPQDAKTGAYTFALADASKIIPNTTGGWVIPANASVAFPVDSVISGYNDSASSQTLSITSDTLVWMGIGTTGSRTIAAYGGFTAWKKASTTWVVWGAGLS